MSQCFPFYPKGKITHWLVPADLITGLICFLLGLQKRFRHVVPHCLYINCRSHRLALAVKHLMKFFPVLVSVDEALLSIYHLFDNSPQRFGVFKDVQESYAIRELVLVRAAATRWLSHGQACKRVIDRFVQVK